MLFLSIKLNATQLSRLCFSIIIIIIVVVENSNTYMAFRRMYRKNSRIN